MKCRICASTEHLMARCPKKGEGKGSSGSSGGMPGFAGYAAEPSYLERGRRETDTALPVTGTGRGDGHRKSTPSVPRPPWEDDESHELQIPPGYVVLAGEDPDQEEGQVGTHHVFMNRVFTFLYGPELFE